jgi:serine/threonine-protein kinase
MGRVYLAHDSKHDRRVAIKILDPGYAHAVGTQRFVREIRIAALLTHPSIVPLYDSGEFEGQLFYVMPHIEGESLREGLNRDIMFPVDQTLRWAAEITDALVFAHGHGIVHRDIKPENLLIQGDRLLLADFGVARAIGLAAGEDITSEQLVVGTPIYMSPEQAGGSKVDGRSDIYSLGCVVYEMLAGEPPFGGASAQAVTAKKLSGHYPAIRVIRPTVPKALDETIARALAVIPADRFRTAQEFAAALRDAGRPRRRGLFLRVTLLGLIAAAGTLAVLHLPRATRELQPAKRPRVVVGMFENRTGDSRYDPLGFMAADWVTEGLQRTGAVDVVPALTALTADRFLRAATDVGDPVRALARETGADLVVTGAIYQDHDSLVVQAQLADAALGRLVGAVEPLHTGASRPMDALQELRNRLMGLLALSQDDRVLQTERPPTYTAYLAFSEGMDAYVGGDYESALGSFQRARAVDTSFVLPLLYASFCLANLHDYAPADSVLRIVATQRDRLSDYDRLWLDYQRAELAGDNTEALRAIRRAAEMAPSSKATYNFAVVAFEARQPFLAESALGRLSPDLGPMRGWAPYWVLLASALHAQRKYRQELMAGSEELRRFPGRVDAYLAEARALAAERNTRELEPLWEAVTALPNAAPVEVGLLALEVGDELRTHGDSGRSVRWFDRAYRTALPGAGGLAPVEVRWLKARAAARLGRLREALELGRSLPGDDPGQRDDYLGFVGLLSAQLGEQASARAVADQLANDQGPFTFGEPQVQAARIAAVLGDTGQVTRLLTSAYRKGYPYDLDFHRDRALASVRNLAAMRQLEVPVH